MDKNQLIYYKLANCYNPKILEFNLDFVFGHLKIKKFNIGYIEEIDFDKLNFLTITKIISSYNHIKVLNNLPNSFNLLNCSHNQITSLDNLPNSLSILDCSNNNFKFR